MFKYRLFLVLVFVVFGSLVLFGCTKHSGHDETTQVSFGEDHAEFMAVIAVDLSGSFADRMTHDGKAYEFTMRIADNYFRNSVGSKNRIIIAQLSAPGRQSLLWDGTPIQLRQDFPSATAFRNFLLTKSHPAGSRIHDGVIDALDYVLTDPGVTKGKTRSALFVLSDFDDNAASPEQSERRLVQSLDAYAKKNGIVGFYFLEHSRMQIWRRHLQHSGFKNWACESEIVAYPTLPTFE